MALLRRRGPGAFVLDALLESEGAGWTVPWRTCPSAWRSTAAREIVMTRLVEGDAAFTEKPEITSRLMEIGRSCANP